MKSIDEIAGMSPEELERVADDISIEVPERIGEKVADSITAQAAITDMSAEKQAGNHRLSVKRHLLLNIGLVSAAACIIMFFATPLFKTSGQPEDTFDDPRLAYAELEKTFSYISSKMDKGLEIASEAEPVFEKTGKVFNNKINDNKK